MSEISYDGYPELIARLDAARRSCARTYIAENILKFITVFCGSLLMLTLIAALGTLSPWIRWTALLLLAALLLGGAILFIFKPLFRQWTDEEIAVRVESRFPHVENALINSIQLANDPMATQHAFVARLVSRTERDTRGIRFADAIERRGLLRFGLAAGAVVVGLTVYAVFWGDVFGRALQQIARPDARLREVGSASILDLKPGSTVVVAGDPVQVIVQYQTLRDAELDASITCRPTDASAITREMKPLESDKFTFTFPEVRAPFDYHVTVGGTESDSFHISVTERPAVTRIDLSCQFPAYSGLQPQVENDSLGDIKALTGARATLRVTASKPIKSGSIDGYGYNPSLHVDKENPRLLTGELTVTQSGSYTIRLLDREGNENRSPAIHRITALPDQPPTVRLVLPGKDITAEPGDKINIAFQAADDYRIVSAEFIVRRQHSSDPTAPAAAWNQFTDPRNAQGTHPLFLDPKEYKPGDVLEYYVRVADNCPVPGAAAGQAAQTPTFLIKVLDKAKLAEEKIQNLQDWAERLRKVLDQELAVRASAAALDREDDPGRLAAAADPLAQTQAAARTDTLKIIGDIQPNETDTRRVKEVLTALAHNEMANAVRHAETMKAAPALDEKKKDLAAFEKNVDAAIAVLRKILDILPKMEEQAKKQADEDKGVDLSNDAKEKLKDLERGLKDFIEEQKKVIDATQELAQKNVDDFTKEDDKKLKDLAATEDKWSQFLLEKHTDLSKLPEQDLANSTLLKDLIEVQSEVQMAKDALGQKAAEIATALEDNGLEMAKDLTTHIEKWLPDTPDRDQWKMEEMLGENSAPMAELPKELEDLVGDLMEQEEDLMQDAEDATAGYADSLDKGAGWDAMDGPISNMSAQGVTGNRLPNQSEIGGRSGEGRSGKSSGEFVGEDAVGKGGRVTPTRLTPDAYEKGQINDTSKDPAGGSTGGGKASGAGAGGLEGPVPPQVEARLKGLAAKQAELRNKAEKIDAKFKVMSWPSPFEETVKAMKQAEDDLRGGRYQNVLRQRPIILKNLKDTRLFLQEQVRISKDSSSPLPHNLQDEILDASEGAAPRGYEQLLKDYYKSISQQNR